MPARWGRRKQFPPAASGANAPPGGEQSKTSPRETAPLDRPGSAASRNPAPPRPRAWAEGKPPHGPETPSRARPETRAGADLRWRGVRLSSSGEFMLPSKTAPRTKSKKKGVRETNGRLMVEVD